jgi:hypothetical protein
MKLAVVFEARSKPSFIVVAHQLRVLSTVLSAQLGT